MAYKFSIKTTCKSKAKPFLKIKKIEDIIFGEHYKITYEIKNESNKAFPGGNVFIQILYRSNVVHNQIQRIDRVEKGGSVTIEDNRPAVGAGYATFHGEIKADDDEPVKIIGYEPRHGLTPGR